MDFPSGNGIVCVRRGQQLNLTVSKSWYDVCSGTRISALTLFVLRIPFKHLRVWLQNAHIGVDADNKRSPNRNGVTFTGATDAPVTRIPASVPGTGIPLERDTYHTYRCSYYSDICLCLGYTRDICDGRFTANFVCSDMLALCRPYADPMLALCWPYADPVLARCWLYSAMLPLTRDGQLTANLFSHPVPTMC